MLESEEPSGRRVLSKKLTTIEKRDEMHSIAVSQKYFIPKEKIFC